MCTIVGPYIWTVGFIIYVQNLSFCVRAWRVLEHYLHGPTACKNKNEENFAKQ
jgi:hypothetical protein